MRRLLVKLKTEGDQAVVHQLRGKPSNRKLDEKVKSNALEILGREVYAGFGPTLSAEYLADQHDIRVGRETVRAWMTEGKRLPEYANQNDRGLLGCVIPYYR